MLNRRFKHKYVLHYTYQNEIGQMVSETRCASSRVPIVQNYQQMQNNLCDALGAKSVFIQNITPLNKRFR